MPTSTPSTQEGADALRTDFHVDYDRVVFFRRVPPLRHKTQVHPFAEHDHTHNRLTPQCGSGQRRPQLGQPRGRDVANGRILPLGSTPSDIGAVVQVALPRARFGQPAFGHTGEEALRDWFRKPRMPAIWPA